MKLPHLKSRNKDKEKLSTRAKRKIKEYVRVLKVTKKPSGYFLKALFIINC